MGAAEAIDHADPFVGQLIDGRYRIHELIGRGGVGIVYLATELTTGHEVVVKFLNDGLLANERAVARFEREAHRLGAVRHPNIVAMLDHGQDRGRGYLVMEFVEGEMLDEYIARRGRLSLQEFVPIAAQILKGMAHAHERDVMIRDIKPSNVMLCSRGGKGNFVKILDFGLAKKLQEEFPITVDHVVGTVGYVPPEALQGAPADLRVDVYAVGMLFYRMLTGELPFEGHSNATIFFKTVHETPPDPEERLPEAHGIPRPILDLVNSCIERDPGKRPPDAKALVAKLIEAVPPQYFRLPEAGAAVTSRHLFVPGETVSLERPLRRPARPRMALAFLAVAAGVAAAVSAAGVGLHDQPAPPAEEVRAEVPEPTPPPAVAPTPPAPGAHRGGGQGQRAARRQPHRLSMDRRGAGGDDPVQRQAVAGGPRREVRPQRLSQLGDRDRGDGRAHRAGGGHVAAQASAEEDAPRTQAGAVAQDRPPGLRGARKRRPEPLTRSRRPGRGRSRATGSG